METPSKKLKEKGYVHLPRLLTPRTIQIFSDVARHYENISEYESDSLMYYENNLHDHKEQLCRVEKFLEQHEELCKIIQSGFFLELLKELTGKNHILFKEKINFKKPGGGGFRPHQDAPAFTRFIQKK